MYATRWRDMFMAFKPPFDIDPEIVEAFCHAASFGDIDTVVNYLDAYGESIIDLQDNIKARAITWAAFSGHLDIVGVLLERGAAIDAGGTGGKPALSWAIDTGRVEAIDFLLKHGASMQQQDHQGQTPLDYAKASSNPKIMPIFQRYIDAEREKLDNCQHKIAEAAIKDMVETKLERMKRFKAPKFKQP